jgi:hypothetical protein
VKALEAHADAAFVYSALTMFDPNGVPVHVPHTTPHDSVLPGEVAVEAVLSFMINHSELMHHSTRTAGPPGIGTPFSMLPTAARRPAL